MNAVNIGNLKYKLSDTNQSENEKTENSSEAFFLLFSLLFLFLYKCFSDDKIILIMIIFFSSLKN